MTTSTDPRKFLGTEIAPAIVEAISALPSHVEIVEMSAGENMPITITLALPEDESTHADFQEYWWDGERWNETGW